MNKTCPCGVTFTLTRHNQKYCPACREMRHNARKPQVKPCANCGTPTRRRRQRKPYCSVCFAEASRKQIEAVKAQRREAHRQELDAKRGQDDKEEYMGWLEQQSRATQQQHFYTALGWLINLLLGEGSAPPAEPEPEEVSPEQVPHDDQDEIDVEFRRIMGDVDL